MSNNKRQLICALYFAGLGILTYTPTPMRFLNELLGRSEHERPFMILVVGHPTHDWKAPDLAKKTLEEIATFI
jgi:iodotyrosine deiodinase